MRLETFRNKYFFPYLSLCCETKSTNAGEFGRKSANQDAHRDAVLQVLEAAYGRAGAALWAQRWRMFWMSCAELFGYRNGEEWKVAHYRFVRR